MKKRLLTALACIAIVLFGTFALTACGGPTTEEITKADVMNYIDQYSMYFEKGYKYSIEENQMSGTAEVVKNGTYIDAKITGHMQNEDRALYLKNGEGFELTAQGLEKMNDITSVVSSYSTPLSDCSAYFEGYIAPDTTSALKTTDGNTITFTYVEKLSTLQFSTYDINFKITFVNNKIKKFEASSVNPSEFVYKITCEEFSGPVDFSGVDFNNYNKTFNLGHVTVTLTNTFVKQANVPSGADYYLQSDKVVFLIQHEDMSIYPTLKNMTVSEYASALENNIKSNPKVLTSEVIEDTANNLVYVKYNSYVINQITTYTAFVFKGNNNIFYVCQFGCYQNDFSTSLAQIIQWAKTITVD